MRPDARMENRKKYIAYYTVISGTGKCASPCWEENEAGNCQMKTSMECQAGVVCNPSSMNITDGVVIEYRLTLRVQINTTFQILELCTLQTF